MPQLDTGQGATATVPNPNLNGETGLKGIYMRLQVKPIFIHTYGSVPFNSRASWPTTATPELGGEVSKWLLRSYQLWEGRERTKQPSSQVEEGALPEREAAISRYTTCSAAVRR